MRLLYQILSICVSLTYMRATIYAAKDGNKVKPGKMYRSICRDVNMSKFITTNRAKNMELANIEELGFIAPASCIPADDSQISDQCKADIKRLIKHREDHQQYLNTLRNIIDVITKKMATKMGYISGVIKYHELGEQLAHKVYYRNIYMINYFYSRGFNIGQCFGLSSRAFVKYVTELSKAEGKLPKMQLVKVKSNVQPTEGNFKQWNSRVNDHVFFVIGGGFPTGKFEISIDPTKPIPKKYLKGWVCDLWNKELVFGKLRKLASKNKIYDMTKWTSVTVKDMSDPYTLSTDKNYDPVLNKKLLKYDYFLNPELFLELLREQEPRFSLNWTEEEILDILELPMSASAEIDDEDEPEHPEL